MYEIRPGRSAQLMLDPYDANDLIKVLKFRLQCKSEKKTGMIALGFGRSLWVDVNGNYMDGETHDKEVELMDLLTKLAI